MAKPHYGAIIISHIKVQWGAMFNRSYFQNLRRRMAGQLLQGRKSYPGNLSFRPRNQRYTNWAFRTYFTPSHTFVKEFPNNNRDAYYHYRKNKSFSPCHVIFPPFGINVVHQPAGTTNRKNPPGAGKSITASPFPISIKTPVLIRPHIWTFTYCPTFNIRKVPTRRKSTNPP